MSGTDDLREQLAAGASKFGRWCSVCETWFVSLQPCDHPQARDLYELDAVLPLLQQHLEQALHTARRNELNVAAATRTARAERDSLQVENEKLREQLDQLVGATRLWVDTASGMAQRAAFRHAQRLLASLDTEPET